MEGQDTTRQQQDVSIKQNGEEDRFDHSKLPISGWLRVHTWVHPRLGLQTNSIVMLRLAQPIRVVWICKTT